MDIRYQPMLRTLVYFVLVVSILVVMHRLATHNSVFCFGVDCLDRYAVPTTIDDTQHYQIKDPHCYSVDEFPVPEMEHRRFGGLIREYMIWRYMLLPGHYLYVIPADGVDGPVIAMDAHQLTRLEYRKYYSFCSEHVQLKRSPAGLSIEQREEAIR